MQQEEPELITRAQKGDQKAYRSLYEQHVGPLFRFLRQFSQNEPEVEDWTQRAFIKAFRNLDAFEGRSRFSSWLFRIAINEMRDDRRRLSLAMEDIPSNGELRAAEHFIHDFVWKDTMKAMLKDIDETKRSIFILYEVEGYSHAEIAEMLKITEGTSRSILSRTKQILKTRWQQEEMKS